MGMHGYLKEQGSGEVKRRLEKAVKKTISLAQYDYDCMIETNNGRGKVACHTCDASVGYACCRGMHVYHFPRVVPR